MPQYLESTKVKLFPSAYRGNNSGAGSKLYNPESRVPSEDNLTNMIQGLTNRDGFVISKADDLSSVRFVLKGYLFDIDLSDNIWVSGLPTGSSIFASIQVAPKVPGGTTDTTNTTYTLISLTNQETPLSDTLDVNNSFGALALDSSEPSAADGLFSLKILTKDTTGWIIPTASTLRFVKEFIENADGLNIGKVFNTDTFSAVDAVISGNVNITGGSTKALNCFVPSTFWANITLNGASITPSSTEVSSLGASGKVFKDGYIKNISSTDIAASSTITANTFLPSAGGLAKSIGSVSQPFSFGYINGLNTDSISCSGNIQASTVGASGNITTSFGNISAPTGTIIATIANASQNNRSYYLVGHEGAAIGTNSAQFAGTNKCYFNGSTGQITATSFNATSDERLKENIEDFVLTTPISDVTVKTYNFIDNPDEKYIGVIAQDLQKVYPELINEDDDGFLSIKESKLVYLLMAEVKELRKRIEELEKKVG